MIDFDKLKSELVILSELDPCDVLQENGVDVDEACEFGLALNIEGEGSKGANFLLGLAIGLHLASEQEGSAKDTLNDLLGGDVG